MNLSSDPTIRGQQLTAIKNYVEANHQVNGSGVYDAATAAAMNALASPSFYVFLSSVSVDAVRESLDWAEALHSTTGMTPLQQFGFNTLFHNGDFDPSLRSSRDAIVRIFDGDMTNTRAAVLAKCTKLATIAEKILAVTADGPGGGDGSAANQSAVPGDGAIGNITVADLQEAESNG